jgi:hypothetical protein
MVDTLAPFPCTTDGTVKLDDDPEEQLFMYKIKCLIFYCAITKMNIIIPNKIPNKNLYFIDTSRGKIGKPFFVEYFNEVGKYYQITKFSRNPVFEEGDWIELNDNCHYFVDYYYVGYYGIYDRCYGKIK